MSSRKTRVEVFSMTLRVCLVVLVACAMMTTIAQAGKIIFPTDRTTAGDYDIWKMRDNGDFPEEVTSESGDANHPSISHNGNQIVYDHGDDLWIVDADGTGAKNLTLTSSGICSGADLCNDPDGSPRINADNDFRIVFTRTYQDTGQIGNPTITEIYMGTVDISERTLGNFWQITDIVPQQLAQLQPSWCGSDHVMWSRASAQSTGYKLEICVVEVDSTGPVGDPQCYFGESTDTKDDHYPSCSPDASQIAWTRGSQYGTADIFRMDCIDLDEDGDQFDDCDTANADNLTASADEDTHPVFSPGGTKIAWTSEPSSGGDYEIWIMNASDGTGKTQLTTNDDDDLYPDWGPIQIP